MGIIIKQILGIILGIFLIILALLVITVITPLALIWKIQASIFYENRKPAEIIKGTAVFFIAIAASLDKMGNCAFGGFFNAILLKNQVYKFGRNNETVSEVLGWAHRFNDLNRLGFVLFAVLDLLDKNHCKKAMLAGISRAEEKVKFNNSIITP